MGLTKAGKLKLWGELLSRKTTSKEEANALAAEVRSFGYEYGFSGNEEYRFASYCLIFGITKSDIEEHTATLEEVREKLAAGVLEVEQVISNDVHRSFVHFEGHNSFSKEELVEKKLDLKAILVSLCSKEKGLSYYQGLNFVSEAFYLTFGLYRGYTLLLFIVNHLLKPYMQGNDEFNSTIRHKMRHTHQILRMEIPRFDEIMDFDGMASTTSNPSDSSFQKLSFAVSWYITFMAYRISDLEKVNDFYDNIVCSLFKENIVYMVASIILHIVNDNGISIDSDKSNCMMVMYNGRHNDIGVEEVIQTCFDLMNKYSMKFLFECVEKYDKEMKIKSGKNSLSKLFGFFKKK